MSEPAEYTRPALTDKQLAEAAAIVKRLMWSTTPAQRNHFVMALATENMRLLAECNEHRAARGFAPLPAYEVK